MAGFGNGEWDTRAYLAVAIPANKIFLLDRKSRVVVEASGQETTYRQIIHNINYLFPSRGDEARKMMEDRENTDRGNSLDQTWQVLELLCNVSQIYI